MNEPVIRLSGVGKRYLKYEDAPMLATAMLRLRARTRKGALWAVRDLDLEVRAGECVGVIGRNGSGKSTTLQMVSGITAPTEGRVTVRGRIAPLISVGVGFHPELTGRDNVYINGAILGMSRREIDSRFDEIVDFAEMGSFIDTPVKFYSSGMTVRLGFAVAITAEPEVLIVDEVLAVGDLAFQIKCFDRMEQIRSSGATILVVSHNLNSIRRLCQRAVVLHAGRKQFEGSPEDAISKLHALLGEAREPEDGVRDASGTPFDPAALESVSVELLGSGGTPTHALRAGDQAVARVSVTARRRIEAVVAHLLVHVDGTTIFVEGNMRSPFAGLAAGESATYDIGFDVRLASGSGALEVSVGELVGNDYARISLPQNVPFYVSGRPSVQGYVDLCAVFRAVQPISVPPA